MNYPKYKNRRTRYFSRMLLGFVIINYLLSLIIPWYTYVHGSVLFLIMSYRILKSYRGFKAFSGVMFSILLMLIVFDFKDFEFTWSLDYVFPGMLIFMSVIFLFMILTKKSSWRKHHDIHVYLLLLNLLMIILMFMNIITTNIVVIITYGILVASVIIIRLKVGGKYKEDIDKFTHY
ncbi:MAG: hypothetical protein JEZ08_12865 [Clostridiales bacterium]|nr:hypothetical protein [Clostridiales bacterium]